MTFPAFSIGTPHSSGSGFTSRDVAFGATLDADDGLLLVALYRDGAVTAPGGSWVEIVTQTQQNFELRAWLLVASGGETSLTLTTVTGVQMIAYPVRIPSASWASATTPEGTTDFGTADPPSETASWGSDDNGWIAVNSNNGGTVTAFPTGFADDQFATERVADSLHTGICTKEDTASTLDPGAFTTGAFSRSLVATIVVRGAAAGGSEVAATPGTLTLSPVAAATTPGAVTVNATPGSLNVAPVAATATPGGTTVQAAVGVFSLSAVAATPQPGAVTAIAIPGTLTLAPVTVTPSPGSVTVEATPGPLTLDPVAADPTPGPVTTPATTGSLTLHPVAASPQTPGGAVPATPGEVTLTPVAASPVPGSVTVPALAGALTLLPVPAAVPGLVAAQPGTLTLTPVPASIPSSTGENPTIVRIREPMPAGLADGPIQRLRESA